MLSLTFLNWYWYFYCHLLLLKSIFLLGFIFRWCSSPCWISLILLLSVVVLSSSLRPEIRACGSSSMEKILTEFFNTILSAYLGFRLSTFTFVKFPNEKCTNLRFRMRSIAIPSAAEWNSYCIICNDGRWITVHTQLRNWSGNLKLYYDIQLFEPFHVLPWPKFSKNNDSIKQNVELLNINKSSQMDQKYSFVVNKNTPHPGTLYYCVPAFYDNIPKSSQLIHTSHLKGLAFSMFHRIGCNFHQLRRNIATKNLDTAVCQPVEHLLPSHAYTCPSGP